MLRAARGRRGIKQTQRYKACSIQLATELTTWLTTLAGPVFFVMHDQAIINMAMQ